MPKKIAIRLPREPGPDEVMDVPLRLGDWLVRRRLISRAELFIALKRSYRYQYRIGDAVVTLGLLDRSRLEQEVWAMQHFNAFCGQSSNWINAQHAS